MISLILIRGLQALLDDLDLGQLHAHALAVHQRAQGLLHAPGRVAAQAGAAARGVHAAGHPLGQGASGATAAAWLPHQLLAAHRGAAARQLLLGARRAVDGLVGPARPGHGGQQQQRGHEAEGQHGDDLAARGWGRGRTGAWQGEDTRRAWRTRTRTEGARGATGRPGTDRGGEVSKRAGGERAWPPTRRATSSAGPGGGRARAGVRG